jgi:hypothetical protein
MRLASPRLKKPGSASLAQAAWHREEAEKRPHPVLAKRKPRPQLAPKLSEMIFVPLVSPFRGNSLVTFKSVYMGLHKRELMRRATRGRGRGLFRSDSGGTDNLCLSMRAKKRVSLITDKQSLSVPPARETWPPLAALERKKRPGPVRVSRSHVNTCERCQQFRLLRGSSANQK